MDGLFSNVGETLKSLAKIFFYINAAAYVIAAFAVTIIFDEMGNTGLILILSFLAAGFMIFLSWVFSCILYGFGELVENSAKIKTNTADLMSAQFACLDNTHSGSESLKVKAPDNYHVPEI